MTEKQAMKWASYAQGRYFYFQCRTLGLFGTGKWSKERTIEYTDKPRDY